MSLNDVTAAAVPASRPIAIAYPDTTASSLITAGETLLKSLSEGRFLSPDIIRAALTSAFGGSDAEGRWVWKDAYEAIEVAEVMFLRKYLPSLRRGGRTPEEIIPLLKKIAALLPTHTRRSEESVALQQFSTPMDLAFLASVAADLRGDDVVLEPSAGTGLLAVFAEAKSACLYLNEFADTRSAILEALFPHALIGRFNAEAIDDHLSTGFTPSVVIMNPPFSVSPNVKGRMAGIDHRHVKSALARLAPGGRLVAITGIRFSPDDADYAAWFKDIESFATLSFTAALDGKIFQRHGTSVETRFSVFDKVPTPPVDQEVQRGVCASTEELAALIETHVPPPPRNEGQPCFRHRVGRCGPRPQPAAPRSRRRRSENRLHRQDRRDRRARLRGDRDTHDGGGQDRRHLPILRARAHPHPRRQAAPRQAGAIGGDGIGGAAEADLPAASASGAR